MSLSLYIVSAIKHWNLAEAVSFYAQKEKLFHSFMKYRSRF